MLHMAMYMHVLFFITGFNCEPRGMHHFMLVLEGNQAMEGRSVQDSEGLGF